MSPLIFATGLVTFFIGSISLFVCACVWMLLSRANQDGAVVWLRRMVDEMGLQPNAITVNSVIEAHAKSGDKVSLCCHSVDVVFQFLRDAPMPAHLGPTFSFGSRLGPSIG
jgi:hypothetical protein